MIEDAEGRLAVFKSPTTPEDPTLAILDVLSRAAEELGMSRRELLAAGESFVHGTTRAINAIVTGSTARTAFLTTEGHPDVLLWREGGRPSPFDFDLPFPEPYVPRRLTFEIAERVGAHGEIVKPIDDAQVAEVGRRVAEAQVEAAGVCLLWSIVNPAHELRVREILLEAAPGVEITLSHELNPTMREYRRASATCIDASLKPVMSSYLSGLEARLREEGYAATFLVMTSTGGVLPASAVAEAPIHTINSGPAGAPIAARAAIEQSGLGSTAIVADTGGTTFDVSLIRRGEIPSTRETWLGGELIGHMTGFPSVDIKSVGAGGGSIAWVDGGGLLRVGPQSAGSEPGPACYGRGGIEPTVTDACVVLGYIDPGQFLGGQMQLDVAAAERAIRERVAERIGLDVPVAAQAILDVATQHMVGAIEEITVNQGIDPTSAVLVAGGGAAGLNAVPIAQRLGVGSVVFPPQAAVLSAIGMMMSDLATDVALTARTDTRDFDFAAIDAVLAELEARARRWASDNGVAEQVELEYSVEARYPAQIWELEVAVGGSRVGSEEDVAAIVERFHALHEEIFGIRDPGSEVELLQWRVRASAALRHADPSAAAIGHERQGAHLRRVHLSDGWAEVPVMRFEDVDGTVAGPLIVENEVTTIVVVAGAEARLIASGDLVVTTAAREPAGDEWLAAR